jgi:hypothetical protein
MNPEPMKPQPPVTSSMSLPRESGPKTIDERIPCHQSRHVIREST